MPSVIFSEGSGLNDSVFGACQAPIRMFIENRGELHQQNSILKHLFLMGTSNNYGESLTSMTAMSGFDPVGENGAYPQDSMEEGFSKFMRFETWKDSFAISQEMVEDSKVMDLKRQPAAFMTAYERGREMFGASLYAHAMMGKSSMTYRGKKFDTTAADGKALFAVDHPNKVKGKAQCNLFSDPFSVDALGRMESKMHLFAGDTGEILDVAPTTILISEDPDQKKEVFAAIGADKDPATANNGFNYQFGRWNVIVWSYLNQFLAAGSKPWVLLDTKYNETYGGAVFTDRVKLTVKSSIDEGTDANVWRGRARFNAGFNDWRFAACGGMAGGQALAG